jgi:hypothetical protein
MTIKFKNWNCEPQFLQYSNKRTAIRLIDSRDGDPIAVATVNLPDEELNDNEVIIKDYSENKGMLQSLQSAGIVSEPLRYIKTGFVKCPVCTLLTNI